MATSSPLITDGHDDRPTYQEAASDLAGEGRTRASAGLKRFMWLLGLLAVLGVVGIVAKFITSNGQREDWGYYAAIVAWMIAVFGGAPMVAIAPSLAKANWARPAARIASLGAVFTAVAALAMIPLITQLPALTAFSDVIGDDIRRRSIWFDSPRWAPHFWNILTLSTLVVAGLAMAYLMALPDFAAIRDHGTGWKQRWGRRLARGFYGRPQQWEWLRMRIGVLGAFYFAILLFVNFMFSIDFAVSLVPGWKDAIFPWYSAISSIQSGIAFSIIGLWAARRWGGASRYIGQDQMWALGKLLLATTLLWFYFFYSAFIVFWYGRTTPDTVTLKLLISGPYVYVFWLVFLLMFIAPWWVMIWNKVRDSLWGPPIAATMVLVGILLDRIRLYVGAWTAEPNDLRLATVETLEKLPVGRWPDLWDVFLMVGIPAAGLLAVLLLTRLVPVVSLWEVQQSRLISKPVRFLRGHGLLIGKPD